MWEGVVCRALPAINSLQGYNFLKREVRPLSLSMVAVRLKTVHCITYFSTQPVLTVV